MVHVKIYAWFILLDFLVKKYFVDGISKNRNKKVDLESHKNFHEAIKIARIKFRRMMYKLYKIDVGTGRLSFGLPPKSFANGMKIVDLQPQTKPFLV